MSAKREIDLSGMTLTMAVVDALPVLLFGGSCILIGALFHSILFLAGAVLSLAAGAGKVIWKIIAARRNKNIWWLNRQFRYLMPLGFLGMLLSIVVNYKEIDLVAIRNALFQFPAVLFFIVGIIGMVMMLVFTKSMNDSIRAVWTEQITNTIAQLGFFIGILLVLLN